MWQGLVAIVWDLPQLLWRGGYHWFISVYGFILIYVLCIGGGAIARMQACWHARSHRLGMNDAIDFSGSEVSVYNSYFNNVGDKLISAGENSKINIYKIKAFNSHAGIISKDGSEVYSSDIDFNGVLIPFAAYQKKKEYNYGSLIVKNYNINNFYTKWIKDKESKIIVNNVHLEIETKKILSIINEKKLFLIK